MKRIFNGMLLVVIMAIMATPLFAADVNWIASGTLGDMNDPANWSSNPNLPTGGDVMWIGNATQSTGTANLTTDYSGGNPDVLNIGNGTGFTGTLNESAYITLTTGVNLGVGGGTGTLDMSDGTLTAQGTNNVSLVMGSGAGSTGTMNLSNFAYINATGWQPSNDAAYIGDDNGTAHLTLDDYSTVHSDGNFYVGRSTGSNADVTLNSGSTLSVDNGWTVIGGGYGVSGGGTATLTVNDFATFSTTAGYTIFGYRGGSGTLNLNGSIGAYISNMQVGNSEDVAPTTGEVNISSVSSVITGQIQCGNGLGATGTINLDPGALLTMDSGFIGHSRGVGYLNIGDSNLVTAALYGFQIGNSENAGDTFGTVTMTGGTFNKPEDWLIIGAWDGGHGTLDMSGDSVLNANTSSDDHWFNRIAVGYLSNNGSGSNGTIEMSGNATINSTSTFAIGDSENWGINVGTTGSVGTVNMSGNSVINQSMANIHLGLWQNAHGTLNMTDNATINMAGYTLVVGDDWYDGGTGARSSGEVNMFMNSQILNPTGNISIGNLAMADGTFTMGSPTPGDTPYVDISVLFSATAGLAISPCIPEQYSLPTAARSWDPAAAAMRASAISR